MFTGTDDDTMNVTRVAGDIFRPSPAVLIRAADAALTGIHVRDHVRVRPGIYAPAGEWAGLAPWERYLARVHAYARVNPHAVFSLESAAALLGLPLFGHPRHIHTVDVGGTSRAYGDVRVHASTDDCDTVTDAGISATGLADTSIALMRVLPPAFGLAVGDAARARGVDSEDLQTLADASSARRGRSTLRWLLPRHTRYSESVGESVSRAVIEWCGFAMPEIQAETTVEGHTYRLDFFWRTARVAGESDGYGKYSGDAATTTAALIREKQREDRLRRHLAGFARWSMADALQVTPLQHVLLSAGVPLVAPPRTPLLRSVAHNPRSH